MCYLSVHYPDTMQLWFDKPNLQLKLFSYIHRHKMAYDLEITPQSIILHLNLIQLDCRQH